MGLAFYLRLLSPKYLLSDLSIDSINDIDIEKLKAEGIEALCFDVDGSIAKFGENSVCEDIKERYVLLREHFKCYIASNSKPERRRKLEEYFGIPAVQTDIKKPNPEHFEEALLHLGTLNSNTAMIGDRRLTDIAGANYAGMISIKVKCLDLKSEPLEISIMRGIENAIAGIYQLLGYTNGKPHKFI